MSNVGSDNSGNGNSGGGLPGVRRLFSRRGFPGTIKSSRGNQKTDAAQADFVSIVSEQPIIEFSALAVTDDSDSSQHHDRRADEEQQPPHTASPSASSSSSLRPAGSASTPDRVVAQQQQQQSADTASPQHTSTTTTSPTSGIPVTMLRSMSEPRVAKFHRILNEPVVDIEALRELAWSGIPPNLRPLCWRLLLGYLPPNRERRDHILARKRREYRDLIPEYYDTAAGAVAAANSSNDISMNAAMGRGNGNAPINTNNINTTTNTASMGLGPGLRGVATEEESALRQVAVDVPRTAPGVPFFHLPRMQIVLERILYIWGVRHPASGYVQGINDLATPFLAVFVSEKMQNEDMSTWTLEDVPESDILDVEADCYWCLCKLLDGIQDHYTYSQPGIQKTLFHVMELVARVEAPTAAHIEQEGVEFMQFAFRWANCLLLREIPFRLGQRLWDTYLAEGSQLKEFLVYVLSSFLLSWAPEVRKMEFQDLIMFLQKVPTQDWTESDIELVLSRAFMWRASFQGATSHFAS